MNFILLTHSREILKKTNTGQLVQRLFPQTQTIIWQRTKPDKKLLQIIASGNTALVYPADDATPNITPQNFENFILIDSTWQEARKIYNRSSYLHQLPRVQLFSEQGSRYQLRRNQIEGGLCTAECVIELLRDGERFDLADELEVLFRGFVS